MGDNKKAMSDYNFITKYAQKKPDGKKETWDDAVERLWRMHRYKYNDIPAIFPYINIAEKSEKNKTFLSAQRLRQFATDEPNVGINKHNTKAYNCSSTYMDRREVFGELMYILLSGAGAGISVQRHHVNKLPNIKKPNSEVVTFIVPDTIEGWADAVQVLMDSYFNGSATVQFQYHEVRPKGSLIAGQFLAPGPDGLEKSLDNIRELLEDAVKDTNKLAPIHVYDIAMFIAEAVLSGGVRRSAILTLFDLDDDDMLNSKVGMYWNDNPQRAMSNNSAVIIRSEAKKEDFERVINSVKTVGEPGFALTEHKDIMYNPCFEIGMLPYFIDEEGNKHSGWSFCNLTEINGAKCETPELFYNACENAAIAGTLQAGYTDFKYLSKWTKKIAERDALIGVSITGVMNSPDILLDPEVLEKGAKLVIDTNHLIADIIGIKYAKRTTAIKPAGNSSILLGTASGIHAEHSRKYIRNIKANKYEIGVNTYKSVNDFAVTESTTSETDYNIAFAIKPKHSSIFKRDLLNERQLEAVKTVQKHWVIPGTDELETYGIPIVHNVSNTISVTPDAWDRVGDYIWEHRDIFTGVSLLGVYGELEFADAPFQTVKTPQELVLEYGTAAIMASGLITDGLHVFKHLWPATDAAREDSLKSLEDADNLGERIDLVRKHDWVRRLKKFANTHMKGDLDKVVRCLKEVSILHKYNKLKHEIEDIDWSTVDFSEEAVRQAAELEMACAGGACEV